MTEPNDVGAAVTEQQQVQKPTTSALAGNTWKPCAETSLADFIAHMDHESHFSALVSSDPLRALTLKNVKHWHPDYFNRHVPQSLRALLQEFLRSEDQQLHATLRDLFPHRTRGPELRILPPVREGDDAIRVWLLNYSAALIPERFEYGFVLKASPDRIPSSQFLARCEHEFRQPPWPPVEPACSEVVVSVAHNTLFDEDYSRCVADMIAHALSQAEHLPARVMVVLLLNGNRLSNYCGPALLNMMLHPCLRWVDITGNNYIDRVFLMGLNESCLRRLIFLTPYEVDTELWHELFLDHAPENIAIVEQTHHEYYASPLFASLLSEL